MLALPALLYACKEDPAIHATRLRIEAAAIQNSTLQAILENDLKFQIDLDEQEEFFAALRADLERCRVIEEELEAISPGSEITDLEENTTAILLAIAKREEQNQRYRDSTRDEGAGMDQATVIEALQQTIAGYNEIGRDTAEVEQLLNELENQQAEQTGAVRPAPRSEPGADDSDEAQPQPEAHSR